MLAIHLIGNFPGDDWLCAICDAQAGQLNWRNPGVVGRSDLETLLASDDPRNWVAISERLLGPPPPGFRFQPKHKAQVGNAASAWMPCACKL